MSQNKKFSEAIKQIETYYIALLKQQNEQDTMSFEECMPLLAETYFNGLTDDNKLEDYLASFENPIIKTSIKNKLKELKAKQEKNSKMQVQASKPKQGEKEKGNKSKDKDKDKDKGKIFQRIEQSGEKLKDAPRKKTKVEKTKDNTQKEDKSEKQLHENRQERQMMQQNGLQKKQGLKKELEKQGKQKCKFVPFCKNEQTCEYFHPNQKVNKIDII